MSSAAGARRVTRVGAAKSQGLFAGVFRSGYTWLDISDQVEQAMTMYAKNPVYAGDPEIPPGNPAEVPQPDLPPGIPPGGPPETTPAPPAEVPPGQPVEVPSEVPRET